MTGKPVYGKGTMKALRTLTPPEPSSGCMFSLYSCLFTLENRDIFKVNDRTQSAFESDGYLHCCYFPNKQTNKKAEVVKMVQVKWLNSLIVLLVCVPK